MQMGGWGTDLNRNGASAGDREIAIEPSTTTLLRLFYSKITLF